jgi:ribose transport system ATP-binding protein/rhamnose transport system ATP-binding protein
MERNQQLLSSLAAEHDGAAFWAILDGDRVFCLNAVAANPGADPQLKAGATPRFEETRIAAALAARAPGFLRDPVSGLTSLVVDVKSHRGHDLGAVGLVLNPSRQPPPVEAIRARIMEQFRAAV